MNNYRLFVRFGADNYEHFDDFDTLELAKVAGSDLLESGEITRFTIIEAAPVRIVFES